MTSGKTNAFHDVYYAQVNLQKRVNVSIQSFTDYRKKKILVARRLRKKRKRRCCLLCSGPACLANQLRYKWIIIKKIIRKLNNITTCDDLIWRTAIKKLCEDKFECNKYWSSNPGWFINVCLKSGLVFSYPKPYTTIRKCVVFYAQVSDERISFPTGRVSHFLFSTEL